MKRHNRKGAIELSASFIVVIIIAIVVVAGGLALFFKLKNNVQDYVDKIDGQTEANIKSMMLNGNYRTAIYPSDIAIADGDAATIAIGITNTYPEQMEFTVDLVAVKYYTSAGSEGRNMLIAENKDSFYTMTSHTLSIAPTSQDVKAILIKLPRGSGKGEYTYTISVTANPSSGSSENYGTLQVYVNNK